MFYTEDINKLISEWIKRSQEDKYTDDYKKAIAECAFELQCMLDILFSQECEVRQYLDEIDADNYLATQEAHDNAA